MTLYFCRILVKYVKILRFHSMKRLIKRIHSFAASFQRQRTKNCMTSPSVIPRPEHTVSRDNIDDYALKVLYRLHKAGFRAMLVGGGVRDFIARACA